MESLGLDEDDGDEGEGGAGDDTFVTLFASETQFKRTGVWCMLEGLAGCSHKGTSNTQSASAVSDKTDASFDLSKAVKRAAINGGFLTKSWEKFRALRSDERVPDESKHQVRACEEQNNELRNCKYSQRFVASLLALLAKLLRCF